MRLDFTVVEVLDFSLSVPILLEHPVICRQNVANKNNINNFFNKSSYLHINPRNNLSSFTLYFDYTKQSSRFSYLILTNSLSKGYFKILA